MLDAEDWPQWRGMADADPGVIGARAVGHHQDGRGESCERRGAPGSAPGRRRVTRSSNVHQSTASPSVDGEAVEQAGPSRGHQIFL